MKTAMIRALVIVFALATLGALSIVPQSVHSQDVPVSTKTPTNLSPNTVTDAAPVPQAAPAPAASDSGGDKGGCCG